MEIKELEKIDLRKIKVNFEFDEKIINFKRKPIIELKIRFSKFKNMVDYGDKKENYRTYGYKKFQNK